MPNNIIARVMATFGAEDKEQYKVLRYCDQKGWPVYHVPNNTFTKSIMVKVRNKLLGVKPGVPDLGVIANGHFCVIEMKSLTGSPTKAQKQWLADFAGANVPGTVAKGADAAIAFLEAVAAGEPPKTPYEQITEQIKPQFTLRNDQIF